ncbi:MAG: hypothetical protein CL805_06360 [Citromicrobium sp.]|nr:hypothetical protein [Citromicrobium sp.]MBT47516.1 hypothetical protein [Citromicrobium sp.]|tara:strand:- start:1356 stop:1862 length:507 start_codon:yes stop_codon:yes gene_type:complete
MRIGYFLAAGALAVAATSVPVPAHAAKYGKWEVGYDSAQDLCVMRANYVEGGASISVQMTFDYDGNKILMIHDSRWTMPTQSTTAELWYTRDWKRTADASRNAALHNEDGKTHIDIGLTGEDVTQLTATDWIIIRPAAGGLFVQYDLGETKPAIDAMWACDEEWDDFW